VSDKKDKLYLFDIDKEKIIKKIDLPPFAVEGVALDNDGNIWFSDDNGAVLRYKFKDL
jgi:sugar lactone lactonase YvrE